MPTAQTIGVARTAIINLGGPAEAARKLRSMSGRPCTRYRVQKWIKGGIATPWHPFVHNLTGISLTDLDPEIYPAFIFNG